MEWHQQGSLQEAQTQHQIEVKRRRQRIALIERLRNRASGLAQAGIVEGHADQTLGAIRQSALQDRLKQLLRLPLAARVKKILRAPTAVLAAVGPDDTSQAAPAEADQRTERLPHTALKRALLGKDTAPVLGDGEKLR